MVANASVLCGFIPTVPDGEEQNAFDNDSRFAIFGDSTNTGLL